MAARIGKSSTSSRKRGSQKTSNGVLVRTKDAPAALGIPKSTYFALKCKDGEYFDPEFPESKTVVPNCSTKYHLYVDLEAWCVKKFENGVAA